MFKQIFPEEVFINDDTFDKYHISLFYKDYILQKEYYPYHFDDWYDRKDYGRFDLNNNVIYPKNSYLKSYTNLTGLTQKNLLFVTDAFLELKKFYDDLTKSDKNLKSSIYTRLNAVKTTDNAEDLYGEYIKKIYPIFEEYFLKGNNDNNPNTINTFIKRFLSFTDILNKFAVINRSSYFKSNIIPSSIDGLRISLEDVNNNIDAKQKANLYVSNNQFDSFVRNASRFGFFIDKNKPWTIVFDLDSPLLKEFSGQYGLYSKKQILDQCYFKAYTVDLENLNNLLITFWNNYVIRNKISTKTLESESCGKTFSENTTLQQLSPDTFQRYFNINWQLRFYSYIRIKEERIKIPQQKFEVLHTDSCKINKLHGTEQALSFINSKINEFSQRLKMVSYNLTSESEFYKLLEQQSVTFNEEDLRF